LRFGGVRRRASAGEIEPQQPAPGVLILRRSELPLPGGFDSHTGEISARAAAGQGGADDIAHAIEGHTKRELDMATNRLECPARNIWRFLVEHNTRSNRRFGFHGADLRQTQRLLRQFLVPLREPDVSGRIRGGG